MEQELKPVYLISGSDRPKIRTALDRLKAYFDPGSVETFSAELASGEDAVAACNAPALFGERTLVVVEHVDGHRNPERRLVGGWKASDVAALAPYLADPAPGTVLALVGEEVGKTSALAKACAKAGDVLVYNTPKKRDLTEWVARKVEAGGARIEREAAELLVELVGEDADALATEADKLATWAGAEAIEAIGVSEVDALATHAAETPVFNLTDAWARRDVAGVLRSAESLLERGEEPLRLLAALAAHLGRLQACQAWAAEGVTVRQAAERLKKKDFYVQKLYAQAREFSAADLRTAAVRLARLDEALKGGSRLAGELELERALIDVTRRAEPAQRS